MTTGPRSLLARGLGLIVLSAGLASLTACSGQSEPDDPFELPPGATALGRYVAILDPAAHTFTIQRADQPTAAEGPGYGSQSVDEATIEQDNVAGSGSASTVELVGNGSPGVDASCPVGFQSNSFCANVTMRSFYTKSVNNAYLQATKITDLNNADISGHSGANSDASFGSLSNALGLWKFTGSGAPTAVLGPTGFGSANAGARDLVFNRPDNTTTKIYLHAYYTATYSTYTQTATDGSAFIDASGLAGATQVLKNGDGITPKTTSALSFGFTFYGTTYAAASTITVNRYGGMSFGSQLTANTGANTALPSSATTAFHPGVFAFWDDINFTTNDTNSGVWAGTSGSAPFRKFVLTWKNMKFTGDTNGTTSLTFAIILNEGSDAINFAYQTMTSSVKQTQANGNSATIGVQNQAGTAAVSILNQSNSTGTNKGYSVVPQP